MRKLLLIILILITFIQNVKSQEKVIQGDTSFWYHLNKDLSKKLELKDFSIIKNDFSFRFWDEGQIVEIVKNNDSISGVLINYIYKLNRRTYIRQDTIFNKTLLKPDKINAAYRIIQNSKILNLQSDNNTKKWSRGCDGFTYIVEHSDKNSYWVGDYWSPSAQDSIPESLIVMDFVKQFSDTLNLNENYKLFKESLPHKGCYNSGGTITECYLKNLFTFGYNASTKLPIGYNVSYRLAYLNKLLNNFGIDISHKFDQHDDYDFSITFNKNLLLLNKPNKTTDYLMYQYRKRKLEFLEPNIVFDNHQFCYGLSLKNDFNIAIGADYLIGKDKTIGGILCASKWINKHRLSISGSTSIFENHIDYKIGISRSFNFSKRINLGASSIGLFYEGFKGYNDINLSLKIWIY